MERAGPLPYVSHRSQAVVAVVQGAAATNCEPPVAIDDAISAAAAWARNVRMECRRVSVCLGSESRDSGKATSRAKQCATRATGGLSARILLRLSWRPGGRHPPRPGSDFMPLRSFLDASGVRWDVWEAHPRLDERRGNDDRRSDSRPDDAPRRAGERRTSPTLTENDGWLVFHCALERRRQRPIPPGWEKLADVELEKLMLRSRPSGPRSRLLE